MTQKTKKDCAKFPVIFEKGSVKISVDKDGDIVIGKKHPYSINESIQALYDAVELSKTLKKEKQDDTKD